MRNADCCNCNQKRHYEKVVSNIQEIKSEKVRIIASVTEGDIRVKELQTHVLKFRNIRMLYSYLTTIPLQLLSIHSCNVERNVDQPRNLAKSVTVE